MRRLTVTISVLAMIAALLPVAALMAAAQEAGPAPQIAPPAGKAAVRATDAITVSGEATGMPDGAVAAELVAIAADGSVMFREAINDVRVSGGQYTGIVGLGCGFGEPGPRRCAEVNPDPTGLITGVALEIEGAPRSNVVRVDYIDPTIERYELVDATTVRVVFSEPVRMPANALGQRIEKPQDWSVDGLLPLTISDPKDGGCAFADEALAQGCTRLLTLPAPGHGEDATPYVEYMHDLSLPALSTVYTDFADNNLAVSNTENSEAVDRIRPAVPNVAQINGANPDADGAVIGTTTEPSVTLTNLTAGHSVQVSVKRDGEAAVVVDQAVPEDAAAGEGESEVVVSIPTLPGEGDYLVTAVATDAAGNASDQASKRGPGRADGPRSSASYVIDSVAPVLVHAGFAENSTTTIEVVFSEDVSPADNAGTWMVGDEELEAAGTGDSRTLTAANALAMGEPLTWQPSSTTYVDRAGNALAPLTEVLAPLPPLTAPQVTSPGRAIYRAAEQQRIAGTNTAGEGLVADLLERGSDEPVQTVDAADGTWEFTAALATDKRYQFQVRLRRGEIVSPRTAVPDIVRDTSAPVVEVFAPASSGLPYPAGAPTEHGVGDSVTVEWRATDTAANDPKLEDHGSVAHIVMVRSDGVRRVIASNIQHQPGQRQSRSYKLTQEDLGGSGMRDFTFDVTVRDLAGNVGADTSGAIRLLASRVGYTPVLVAPRSIEVRFTQAMQGAIAPGEWLVDENPAAAEMTQRSGNTVVVLTAPLVSDPNARAKVEFAPILPPEERLRSSNDTQISTDSRTVVDKVKPALEVERPVTAAVIDANSVRFTGTTDETAFPNTIAAYRSDSSGARRGPALSTARAKADGTWALRVALDANRRNWIVLRASDPSGNNSTTEPADPFTVVEDSIAPVIRLLSPRYAGLAGRHIRLRWSTVEAHKRSVRLDYRLLNGSWKAIASSAADDGLYKWALPTALNNRRFQVRVRAYDQTGKYDSVLSKGLLADFNRPVLRRAKALGMQRVRLYFNEPVDMTSDGFNVDGIRVSRVVKDGAVQTLILRRNLDRTTPVVVYNGTRARDRVGNLLADRRLTADRGFVFSVTGLDADRLSSRTVRLEWRDARNRSTHVKHYRIYRDGRRIGIASWAARSFKDTSGSGANRYVVKAVDDQGRISSGKVARVSR